MECKHCIYQIKGKCTINKEENKCKAYVPISCNKKCYGCMFKKRCDEYDMSIQK